MEEQAGAPAQVRLTARGRAALDDYERQHGPIPLRADLQG